MQRKNRKWLSIVSTVLMTSSLFGGLLVPAHAEGDRVTKKGKVDLTQFFKQQDIGSGLDNEDPGKRDEWFYGQRFGEGNKPNPQARVTAMTEAKKLPSYKPATKSPHNAGAKDIGAPVWQSIGPSPIVNEYWTKGNVSGRVTSIALANGKILIGSAGGGVWSSSDGGGHWNPLTDNQVSLAIGSLAVAASNPNMIYAGTGENPLGLGADAYYGEGLLVSSDGGQTWSNLQQSVFEGERITSVVADPSNAQQIFIGSTLGLFTSADGGRTLDNGGSAVALPDGNGGTISKYQVTSIVQDQQNPNNLYAAVAGYGVYKSADHGATWNLMNEGFPTDPKLIGNTALAIAPSSPNTIYASVANNDQSLGASFGSLTGLYVSQDGGNHWTKLANTPDYTVQASYYLDGDYSQGWYDNTIVVSPTDPKTVVAGGIGILKTTDGGKTWQNIVDRNSGIHPDQHAVVFDASGNLWIGNDGGVFEIMKNGTKKDWNTNLVLTQDYPGMSIFNNGQQVLTGAQDNGSQLYTGQSAWRSAWTGDGAETLFNPNDPNTMYISYVEGELWKTTNGGQNVFTDWSLAMPPLLSAEWVAPLAMDPTDPNIIYEGGENVYKSTNGATNQYDELGNITAFGWKQMTNHYGDPNVIDSNGREYNVSALAVAPSNPSVVYAGYGNGYLEMSTDGGDSWHAISPTGNVWSDPSVAKNNWITGITVSPNNPFDVYVTQSGYRPLHYKTQGHVWHNTDTEGSNKWTDLSGSPDTTGLPNAPINGVALTDDGQLVAASDVGVFISGGVGTWSNLGTGLPNVEVVDVKVAGGVVFAATHGRGTWELSLTQGTNQPAKISVLSTQVPYGTLTNLYGRVVDASNYPVANVSVDLTVNGRNVGTATTAADGNYTLNYTPTGYVNTTPTVTATVSNTKITTTQKVKITTAPVSNISMHLSKTVTAGKSFTISGTATDKFGHAIQNASVDLYIDNNDYTIAQTDSRGNYSFEVIAPQLLKDSDGNWQNQVNFWVAWQQNEGVKSVAQTVKFVPDKPYALTIGSTPDPYSFTITKGSTVVIKGSLQDQYGNAIASSGRQVMLYMNNRYWKKVTLDANGNYSTEITIAGVGSYRFTATLYHSVPSLQSDPLVINVFK